MNALERWIEDRFDFSEFDIMNLLQDKGIISDECVTAKDVCDGDAEKAVAWLNSPSSSAGAGGDSPP